MLDPGSHPAKVTTGLFRDLGLYRKRASSFSAREGGRPMTARAERIIAFVRAEHERRAKRERARRRRAKRKGRA